MFEFRKYDMNRVNYEKITILNIARLSRHEFRSYFEKSQKLNENENSKNAQEPTSDPERPQMTLLRTLFIISRRLSPISPMIVLKTDHYVWGLKRNYYVIWSRDVKTEVTIDHFRMAISQKHIKIPISSRNLP